MTIKSNTIRFLLAGAVVGAFLGVFSGLARLFELWTLSLAGVPFAVALGVTFRTMRGPRVHLLTARLASLAAAFPIGAWCVFAPAAAALGALEVWLDPNAVFGGNFGRLPSTAALMVCGLFIGSMVTLAFRELYPGKVARVCLTAARTGGDA